MDNSSGSSIERRKIHPVLYAGLFLLCLLSWLGYSYVTHLSTPPASFPIGVDITIEEGLSQSQIAEKLKEHEVVRSSVLIHMILTRSFSDKYILAGTYRFTEPLSSYQVAEALTEGLYISPAFALTLPEGFSVKDFYTYLPAEYTFEEEIDLTPYEGYLFPDTYFISKDMSLEDVVTMLKETMDEKLSPYEDAIRGSEFTRDEVLILASIIEREANDEVSMKRVSGILQNRLEIGMALQVDATLDYLLDKTSAELTSDDLMLDSPYNTYEYRGLPPTPISNPGIQAIEAVLYPVESNDMYYLTGDDGVFYYAKDFEGHKRNKARYIK